MVINNARLHFFQLLISHYYYKCDENHILTKKYRAVLRIVAISSLNTCCLRVTSQLQKYFRVSSRRVEALNISGQVIKGIWGMPWHQKAMIGVEVCDKLGGGDKRPLIPRFRSEPGELKHLSHQRRRKKNRFLQQRRAKQEQPKPRGFPSRGCRTYITVVDSVVEVVGKLDHRG